MDNNNANNDAIAARRRALAEALRQLNVFSMNLLKILRF